MVDGCAGWGGLPVHVVVASLSWPAVVLRGECQGGASRYRYGTVWTGATSHLHRNHCCGIRNVGNSRNSCRTPRRDVDDRELVYQGKRGRAIPSRAAGCGSLRCLCSTCPHAGTVSERASLTPFAFGIKIDKHFYSSGFGGAHVLPSMRFGIPGRSHAM